MIGHHGNRYYWLPGHYAQCLRDGTWPTECARMTQAANRDTRTPLEVFVVFADGREKNITRQVRHYATRGRL